MPEEVKKKKKKRIQPVIEELANTPIETPTPEEPVSSEPLPEASKIIKEEMAESSPLTNTYKEKTNFLSLFLITAAVAFVVALISGGLYVYFSGMEKFNNEDNVSKETSELPIDTESVAPRTPAPSGNPTPTATPNPTKLATLKVAIYNGSGKIGEAGNAKTLLEKVGFKISVISNANSFDYTDTIIQTKKTVSADAVSVAKNALSQKYQVKLGDSLDSGSQYDIVVTVGKL